MKNMNSNLSSLFGSLNTGNSLFNSINLSDYSQIKSGSYKKLLKAVYAEEKKNASDTTKTTQTDKASAVSKKDATALSDVRKSADELKTATEAFTKEDLFKKEKGEYDTEKIMGAVKDFAKSYNETLDKTSQVNSSNVKTSAKFMKSMTDTMSKALSKVGVEVGDDGKLSVNEEKFKKADMSRVKSLFAEPVSYGSQIADKAGEIARNAASNSALYTAQGIARSTMPGLFDQQI